MARKIMEREEKLEAQEMESSPLRLYPNRKRFPTSEYTPEFPPEEPSSTAIIAMDRRPYGLYPIRSSTQETKSIAPPEPPQESMPANHLSPVIVVNRSIREELSMMAKVDPGGNGFSGGRGGRMEDGGDRRTTMTLSSILWRQRREAMVKRAALGFRVCAVVFCVVSFSVMAADKTRGWAGDSFHLYKEFRYCISVTILGFLYSGFQSCALITEKHIIPHHIRYYFDFSMDQIFTYLLLSASSSAVTRVDIWQSNWGKDEFTEMAIASVGISFLAFIALAFSSLISGYSLCTRNFTQW